jgi:hypothetical protein
MQEVKIYQIGEFDWIAAHSLKEAKAYAKEHLNIDDDDVDLDTDRELNEKELDELVHNGEFDEETCRFAGPAISFRTKLERMKATGASFPCIFATTDY